MRRRREREGCQRHLLRPYPARSVAVNEELDSAPELVNEDPYGKGWMFKVKMSDPGELDESVQSRRLRPPHRRVNASSRNPVPTGDTFARRHIGSNPEEIAADAAQLGISSLDALVGRGDSGGNPAPLSRSSSRRLAANTRLWPN